MINNAGGILWDDPNYRWQQQLLNGANIANMGWQTALGLMLGSGLGNWLGHQLGNLQQARDENRQINTDATNRLTQNFLQNLTQQPTPQLPTQNSYPFNAPNMSGNGYNPPNSPFPLYPTDWFNQSTQPNNQTSRWW